MDRLTAKSVVLDDPSTENVAQLLLSKHPGWGNWNTTAAVNDLKSRQVEQVDILRVNSADVREVVSNLADSKLPGVDLFTAEHLKLFMGTSFSAKDSGNQDADEKRFSNAYTSLINIVLSGSMPSTVSCFVRSNLLLALPKSNVDIRPIGVGLLMRKVASKLLFQQTVQFNKVYFNDFQYALRSSGMEEVVHSINLARSIHPEWDTFSIDADNAFNSANKLVGLSGIFEHFPKAFPLVRSMYLETSNQFFFKEGVIKVIPSIKGYHQGDVLGTWCYIMTIQPLLRELSEHLQQHHQFEQDSPLILFYVDDGNLCGPHDVLITAIKFLQQNGPTRFGYRIKPTKGAYLIGKCETIDEALIRFNRLTSAMGDIKLAEDIVKIHPDNLDEGADFDEDLLPNKYFHLTRLQRREDYGMKVLGAYVGSKEYITKKLREVISEWAEVADRLIKFPLVQQRM